MYLSGTPLDDDGLSSLVPLRGTLLKLWLDGTSITDNGVKYLNEFDKLVLVSVYRTNITSRGYSELNIPSLASLQIREGVVPQETEELLRKRMPKLFVNTTLDPSRLSRRVPIPDFRDFRTYWSH